eukprot:GHVH01017466.1.p1 GENE.GHVH01017466.1~~GHVH01017466.1.p1  ORF type:complete len:463 (-),score=57.34 GHVH01017466.1:2167-3555(-)
MRAYYDIPAGNGVHDNKYAYKNIPGRSSTPVQGYYDYNYPVARDECAPHPHREYANISDPSGTHYSAGYEPLFDGDIPVVPVIETADTDGPFCTDVPWFGSFSCLMLLSLAIAIFAAVQSNPMRLMAFPNYKGEYCGLDDSVKGKPFIYYPLDPSARAANLMLHAGQCVADCPGLRDVGRPIAIPMMQNEVDEANPGTSGIVVRYTVQSPMYATELERVNVCVPIDKTLRSNVLEVIATYNIQTRRMLGSIENAWPAMLRDVTISMAVFGFISQVALSALPRLTLQFSIFALASSVLSFGMVVSQWGFKEVYLLPFHYAKLYSGSVLTAKFVGGFLLLCFPLSIAFILGNWGVLWEGVMHYDSLKDVTRDLANTTISPIIISTLGVGAIIATNRILIALSSYSTVRPVGGSEMSSAAPFFQEARHMTPVVVVLMVVVLLCALWTMAFLRSSSRFAGCYVGDS